MSTSSDAKLNGAFDSTGEGSATNTNGYQKSSPPRAERHLMTVERPRAEDLQPTYAVQVAPDDKEMHGWYGSMINGLGSMIGALGSIPCCFCCPNPYRNVEQGNVGLVQKFGKFYKAVDPGLVKINPLSEHLVQIDIRVQNVEVPKQICMTKDNVQIILNSVVFYHIVSPHKAAFGISDVGRALVELTQTTLRHVVGAKVLQDVIERREEIAASITEIVEDTARGWGVEITSMLIKDMEFSRELQESLSMAAQSKRIGESKVIAARAEVEAAKLMRKAADILSSAPAMQIRYLEAMQAMAKSANSKVIFLPGLPTNNSAQNAAGIRIAEDHGEGPSSYSKDYEEATGLSDAKTAGQIENL